MRTIGKMTAIALLLPLWALAWVAGRGWRA